MHNLSYRQDPRHPEVWKVSGHIDSATVVAREVPFHPLQSYFSASCHDDMPDMQVGQFTPLYVGHPQTANDANNVGIAFKEGGGGGGDSYSMPCVVFPIPPSRSVFEPYIPPAYQLTMHGSFTCRRESFIWASAMKHTCYWWEYIRMVLQG